MSKITPQERLNLNKLLSNSDDYQDNTDHIRNVKHSVSIRDDIRALDKLKKSNQHLLIDNKDAFRELAMKEAPFLFYNYADLFNRVIKDELDLEIMTKLLQVLKMIEDGKVDQNEGSVMVGKILKELYVDSALKRSDNLDKEYADSGKEGVEKKVEGKKISWVEWNSAKARVVQKLEEAGYDVTNK